MGTDRKCCYRIGNAEDKRKMIRVNLLPIRQARRRSEGRTQIFVFAAALGAAILACVVLYGFASSDLAKTKEKVSQFTQDVAAAKKEVADATVLEKKKTVYEKKLAVLDRLEADRTGPVKMLDEFQAILSTPRNEEERVARTKLNWDVDWDTRRVWIDSMDEKASAFTIKGGAANSNDVAEFLRRMISAKHFKDVQLDFVQTKENGNDGSRYVEFTIFGKIVYQDIQVVAPLKKKKPGPKTPKPKTPTKKGT